MPWWDNASALFIKFCFSTSVTICRAAAKYLNSRVFIIVWVSSDTITLSAEVLIFSFNRDKLCSSCSSLCSPAILEWCNDSKGKTSQVNHMNPPQLILCFTAADWRQTAPKTRLSADVWAEICRCQNQNSTSAFYVALLSAAQIDFAISASSFKVLWCTAVKIRAAQMDDAS